MAGFDRFLIAPFESGLQTNLKSWLLPEDAFSQLNNAYVWRGRVRKRFGSRFMGSGWSSDQTEQLFSRLRINLGTTVNGTTVATPVPGTIFAVGQAFSVGDVILTVNSAVAGPQPMLTTGAVTGTYDISNGNFTITSGIAGVSIWWYPSTPVMGFANYSPTESINDQPSYAFDQQFAYQFAGGFWQRSGTAVWKGSDLNFFWSCNWLRLAGQNPLLFTTNYHVKNYDGVGDASDDPIWWLNNGTWTAASGFGGANGFYFLPNGGAPYTGPFVQSARLIVQFKNRLVLLNTVENDNSGGLGNNKTYGSRARFSHFGSPLSINAWYEGDQQDNAGNIGDGGGYVDAATEEEIISCEFVKDRLIVYFERSTWALVYNNNQVKPFIWQKINTELGSESQFSTVPFDTYALTIGNVGVHSCNGANVQRIDDKIPQEIFKISNKNIGVQRVAGIRDYFVEMVYWCFPTSNKNNADIYPNKVLVYNYKNNSWSFNDDCITAFGYFEQQQGMTWSSTTTKWSEANFAWDSGTIAIQSRQVIAGNQQGFVFIIDSDESRNERAMQITDLTYPLSGTVQLKIINHNLAINDFITIENAGGISAGSGAIYKVIFILDENNVYISRGSITGTYTGGGNAARVSNVQIESKQWNPYVDKDKNVFLHKIDFSVLRTASGAITVDYYPSSSGISILQDGGSSGTNSLLGTGILETYPYPANLAPLELFQEHLWHPLYFQSDGNCIQIRMYFSNEQMLDQNIVFSDFELQGICLYCQPTTMRLN